MTFHKLLIANRGEIACRIIKTAHEMGISCVAVYTEADSNSPFVRMADQAIKLSDSYLNGGEIINAAKQTGAEAIHPGYGFLSENAKFARAVQKEGLIWVGPSSRVITSMGDKLKAKDIAEKAGVPTLPMTTDPKKANTIGYPILIKAAAGGGGKGMRIVEDKKDLKEAIAGAQREAKTGFGDDRVFIERYVASSRHIEIQILGDSHGNVVHLGERECSIQRRHQKIIEESPSPRVDSEMRATMGEAAIKLAKKLKYESAGTVEFLVDDKTGEFWFLEVNTRLQVEHPVTEEVTGKDLVYEQLRIARGEELGYSQDDITWEGSSIEARLYAEDPSNDFLPATGTLIAYESDSNIDARWDTGIEQGSVVGTDFDPMLAKVITKAKTRTDAANKLALALESLHIGGVTTNRDFLVASLRTKDFLKGKTTSDFIEKTNPQRAVILKGTSLENASSAAALWIQGQNRENANILKEIPTGWRNSRLPRQKISFNYLDEDVDVTYQSNRDGSFRVNDGTNAKIIEWTPLGIDIEVNNSRFFSKVTRDNDNVVVHGPWGDALFKILPRFTLPGSEQQAGGLVAPMPGKVIDLKVKVGSKVKKGDTLVILEAMKMEHQVKASEDGKVTKVLIKKDDQLENGALLMVVDS
ncbi:MAG: acetyl/propionyl/methylcrotonyl-CoA carboxylase subunit alpha [Gammaproteobacteria bacterium]|tara:strand:- start:512 stop:2434 length:1923 start_codon:yes stop_codon:yes gene_type:complete